MTSYETADSHMTNSPIENEETEQQQPLMTLPTSPHSQTTETSTSTVKTITTATTASPKQSSVSSQQSPSTSSPQSADSTLQTLSSPSSISSATSPQHPNNQQPITMPPLPSPPSPSPPPPPQQATPSDKEQPTNSKNEADAKANVVGSEEIVDEVIIPRFEDLRGHGNVDDFGFFHDMESIGRTSSSVTTDSDKRSTMTSLSSATGRYRLKKEGVEKYRQRENRWVEILQNWPKYKGEISELKYLCRKGLPVSVRGRVWCQLAGVDKYKKEGVWAEMNAKPKLEIYDVIERDINRCYPDHFFFREKGTIGQRQLFDILKAYAHYNPEVGYCQGMGRLVGLMLMQMPVEDTFWLLVATLDGPLKGYYTPNLDRFRIHSMVFEKLMQIYLPTVYRHLATNDIQPLIYMTQWFLTLYTMVLPWETVLRVWDMFYCEGIKVLFRIGLAVLTRIRTHLLTKCPTSTEIMEFLLHIPHEYLGLEVLETALRINLGKKDVADMEARATRLWNEAGAPNRGTLSLIKKNR